MYSSLPNQMYNLIHYFFGFIVLYIVYPTLTFSKKHNSSLENVVSNFIRMVFLIIVVGYFLVILKIYEFIGLFIVLVSVYYIKKFIIEKTYNFTQLNIKISGYIYDYLDGVRIPKDDMINMVIKIKNELLSIAIKSLDGKLKIINYILLFIVIGFSAYLRFYDALKHAAPAMSDAYVTLAWMKYILGRDLFHDGIYPQGFHIYMASLQKIAYIDPLYILKYSGPFNGVLISFGIFFFISKTTESLSVGVIGAAIYGGLGWMLPIGWERQASSNSQEFGFVFVLPTLYFAYKYVRDNNKEDLITTFCGLSAVALIHTISFAYIAIGIVVLAFSVLIVAFKTNFKKVLNFIYVGIISGIIGVIPICIGLIKGKKFHGSSVDFLLTTAEVEAPKLSNIDYITISAVVLIFIYFILKIKSLNLFELFIGLLSTAAVLSYYWGGVLTNSVVIATRITDFWGLTIPVTIGVGVYILSKVLIKDFIKKIFGITLELAIIIVTIFILKPQPIIPYKMERDTSVEQYLKISKTFRPTEWMIVSNDEGYAVVLGTGHHLMASDFLELFNPNNTLLIRNDTKEKVNIPDVFIYEEKKVFTTQFAHLKATYEKRQKETELIENWVAEYKENHDNLTMFYEDKNLKIYRIHQKSERKEIFDNIWGTVK